MTKVLAYQLQPYCDKVLRTFFPLSFITDFPINYSLPKKLKEVEL